MWQPHTPGGGRATDNASSHVAAPVALRACRRHQARHRKAAGPAAHEGGNGVSHGGIVVALFICMLCQMNTVKPGGSRVETRRKEVEGHWNEHAMYPMCWLYMG